MAPVVYAHNGSPGAAVLVLSLTLIILPIEGTSDTLSSCLGELFLIFTVRLPYGAWQAISVCQRVPANLHWPASACLISLGCTVFAIDNIYVMWSVLFSIPGTLGFLVWSIRSILLITAKRVRIACVTDYKYRISILSLENGIKSVI